MERFSTSLASATTAIRAMTPGEALFLADGVLTLHLAYIIWVIFGGLLSRLRPMLAGLHVVSLLYSIAIELGPWPCPLTLAENWLEARAGLVPYSGPFLLHYLDVIVYPNLSPALITVLGITVCAGNLVLHAWWFYRHEGIRYRSGQREFKGYPRARAGP